MTYPNSKMQATIRMLWLIPMAAASAAIGEEPPPGKEEPKSVVTPPVEPVARPLVEPLVQPFVEAALENRKLPGQVDEADPLEWPPPRAEVVAMDEALEDPMVGEAFAFEYLDRQPEIRVADAVAAPDGFLSSLPRRTSGSLDALTEGFGLSCFGSAGYNTNPSGGFGRSTTDSGGDFYLSLGAGLSYRRKAADIEWSLSYNGGYSHFFSLSELSDYSQSGEVSLTYRGGPLTLGFNLGASYGSGANRYYQDIVDELRYLAGIRATYRWSARTEFSASLDYSGTVASSNYSDTKSLTLNCEALWIYSPLLSFGPGLRMTDRSGSRQGGRTSIGPTLNIRYQLSQMIASNIRVGVDFAEYDTGQSADPTLSASVGFTYRPSILWSLDLTLSRDVEADPAQLGGYSERTDVRLGYERRIGEFTWRLGASYGSDVSTGSTGGLRPDRDFFSIDTSLGRRIFAGSTEAVLFLRYYDETSASGGISSRDSTAWGVSLSHAF